MAMLHQPVLSLVCPMFADFVEKLHPTARTYYHPSEAVAEGCIWHMQRIGIPDPTHLTDVFLDSNESYATEVTIVANPADYPLPAGTTTTGLGQEGVDYNVQAGYTPAATFTIDDMDYPTLERRMQEFELRCRAYRREKRSYYTVFATRGYPVSLPCSLGIYLILSCAEEVEVMVVVVVLVWKKFHLPAYSCP